MTASFDSALRFSFGIIERTKYMKRTQGIMQAPDKKQSGQVVRKTALPETDLPDEAVAELSYLVSNVKRGLKTV